MVKVNIDKLVGEIHIYVSESLDVDTTSLKKKITDILIEAVRNFESADDLVKQSPESEIESLLALQDEANKVAERIQNPLDQIKKIIESDACLDVKCKAIDEVLLSRRHQLRQLIKGQAEALISSVSQEENQGESSNWISKP